MKLARKIDESASDFVGYGMVTRYHQHCGGAADSVHRQRSAHSGCAWKMVTRSRNVFLKMVMSIQPRGLCVPEACDVRIEVVPWMDRQL